MLENEKDKLKKELKDVKEASVIFDGTARLGEALAVIVRYVQENFQPTQRLIRLDIFAKALKGEELAQRLMSCLAVDYHFGPTAIIGGMRDGASVNGAALRQLMFFYPKLFDVVCFSHTIDNVGNHFELKILDLFARYWISMFSHSYNACLVCRARTGQSIRTFSETRWWSKWEVLRQVSEYFGDVEPFLRENDEVSPANRRRLLETYAWSWLHLLMLGCISSMPPIIWKGMGHSFSPAMRGFQLLPGLWRSETTQIPQLLLGKLLVAMLCFAIN